MSAVITKPVKVVKQGERSRKRSTSDSKELLTDAQQQRAMVSVVISWIEEQRESKAMPTQLFRLEPAENEQD